jgi:hypothetical protein
MGQQTFDRLVEALIGRLYSDPKYKVWAVNGRGGDGGLDVVVDDGQALRVFQLKYFPGGFPASGGRRAQIRRSLVKALDEERMDEWTLVVPENLTRGEENFVRGLAKKHGVNASWWGRRELDDLLSQNPDLETYFKRDDLREMAKDYGVEAAMIANGAPDIVDRMNRLQKAIDTTDPHWTFEPSMVNGEVQLAVKAKSSRSAEESPLKVHLESTFGPEHAGLLEQVQRSLGYGVRESVSLPPEIVQKLKVTGPPILATDVDRAEVSWTPGPSNMTGEPVDLKVLDADGTVVFSREGIAKHVGVAPLGISVEAGFGPCFTLILLVPRENGKPCEFSFKFSTEGAYPQDVLSAVELAQRLTEATELEVWVAEQKLVAGSNPTSEGLGSRDTLEQLRLAMTDLVKIQGFTGRHFAVPALKPDSLISLRTIAIMIEGGCTVWPFSDVSPNQALVAREHLPNLLEQFKEDASTGYFYAEYTTQIGRHQIDIGPVCLITQGIRLANRTEILAAFGDTDSAEPIPVSFEFPEGPVLAYMPHRVKNPGTPLALTPWQIPGVPEPLAPEAYEVTITPADPAEFPPRMSA